MFNTLSALAPVIQLGRRLVAPVTDALEAPKKIAKLEQDLEIARYMQSLDKCLLDVTTEELFKYICHLPAAQQVTLTRKICDEAFKRHAALNAAL